MVQQAAVLPAEKKASAAPSRTCSTATVIDERFLRVARVTFSPMPTASAASTTWIGRVAGPGAAQLLRHHALRAHEHDVQVELAAGGHRALDHDTRPEVAPQRVHRDARRTSARRRHRFGQRPAPRPLRPR